MVLIGNHEYIFPWQHTHTSSLATRKNNLPIDLEKDLVMCYNKYIKDIEVCLKFLQTVSLLG